MASASEPKNDDTTPQAIAAAQLHPKYTLTPQHKRLYGLEQYSNSRPAFRLLAVKSTHALAPANLASPELVAALAGTGAFAETANGGMRVDPRWMWANLGVLLEKGGPLEGYEALAGSELLDVFRGDVAELQTIVCRRGKEGEREVVVALSGTERISQVLRDADSRLVRYKLPEGLEEVLASASTSEKSEDGGAARQKKRPRVKARVHAGFYHIFKGLLGHLSKALTKAFEDSSETPALTLTGHSLGGALSFLLAIHVLAYALLPSGSDSKLPSPASDDKHIVRIPQGTQLRVVAFGCPRVGDGGLANVYRGLVEAYRARFGPDSFREYSVKAYGDGIHCIPPRFMGFRHLCTNTFYLVHDHLFHIPPSESECSVFPVSLPAASSSPGASDKPQSEGGMIETLGGPLYPRGGHNYYNGRDMERTMRRLRWLDVDQQGEDGWLERYQNGQRLEDVSVPLFSCCCLNYYNLVQDQRREMTIGL